MPKKTTPPPDDVKIRCPRLGHQIHFAYCRSENHGKPCFKALECWSGHFEAAAFFKELLSAEDWSACFSRPATPKILSLVELIEQAKQRKAAAGKPPPS